MQVVGVNSLSTEYKFGKYLREASILPIYDGGNMGMQRRVHGIIADENFNPRAVMDDDFVKFDRSMEAIGTVADPVSKSRGIMEAAE
jgi:nitroalkane oxidase